MNAKPVLQGAGLATLFIAPFAADFLTPSSGNAYHRIHPLTNIYRAIAVAALLVWVAAGLGFLLLERLPASRYRVLKRALWIVPITLLVGLFFRSMTGALAEWPDLPMLALRIGRSVTPAAAMVSLALLLLRPLMLDRCIKAVRIVYAVAGFGLLVIMPQITYHALRSVPREQTSFERANLPMVSPSAPRIVWILMDELSYDQTFASRQPDVDLPNFDRLLHSSITFSDLRPAAPSPGPGAATEDVLPSLMLGKPIFDLRKPYPGPASYRSSSTDTWHRFNENDTIFAKARSLGWTTGLAGWYNPYCRLLPNVLDRCAWVFSEPIHLDLSSQLSTKNSIAENLLVMIPFRDRLNLVAHSSATDPVQTHIDDYVSLMAQGKGLIQDSRIRFVFVHLPVPHPPGIYDRVHHSIRNHGTYLDNLVLADQSLAELRDAIQTTPAAANTTLIVSSDHSWRTWVWRPLPDWSEQGEQASHGGIFDPRPVLMVSLPNSDSAQVVAKPHSVLSVHTIIEGLLRGQIRTYADIDNLIDQQSQETAVKADVQVGN